MTGFGREPPLTVHQLPVTNLNGVRCCKQSRGSLGVSIPRTATTPEGSARSNTETSIAAVHDFATSIRETNQCPAPLLHQARLHFSNHILYADLSDLNQASGGAIKVHNREHDGSEDCG